MWLRCGEHEEVTPVQAGVSIAIPVGTHFQFRALGEAPLSAVGVTMPPWPGEDEAVFVSGPWSTP
jgi:mannose-6-phosphate isomerase-like protein (cupin superfamily)